MKRMAALILAAIAMLAMALPVFAEEAKLSDKDAIEYALNLANNPDQQWTYSAAESATGADLSGWVTIDDEGRVSFTLADGMACRTSGAAKAVPGFDVIDYGQEDYVFGDSDTDARHWSRWVLKALQENQETLESLFNK